MFRFNNKKRPPIKFYNTVPGVSTLYPVTKSSDLHRDWVSYEKRDYNEKISKCPVKRFTNAVSTTGMPSELSNILNIGQEFHRQKQKQITSVGKCPAVNSMMHSGFIIYAPADFSVYAQNTDHLDTYYDGTFPPMDCLVNSRPYIECHGAEQTKWLKDSTKDSSNDIIIKVCTMWSVLCDDDIAFMQMKVPFSKESRFSAVTGILDPVLSPEINIQLWWHVNDGSEVTIKAGTPLAMYLPISKKMFDYDAEIGTASEDDVKMSQEYAYLLGSQFSENRSPAKKAKKIFKKYWQKWDRG